MYSRVNRLGIACQLKETDGPGGNGPTCKSNRNSSKGKDLVFYGRKGMANAHIDGVTHGLNGFCNWHGNLLNVGSLARILIGVSLGAHGLQLMIYRRRRKHNTEMDRHKFSGI